MSYKAPTGNESKIPPHPWGVKTQMAQLMGYPFNMFCSGCGYGSIAQAINRVFIEENLQEELYPFIINIGCYSSMPTVLPGRILMTLHGRGIAVATGIKMANPRLKPISIHGDGDLLSIGTNHFIHGARRNVDMIVILLNNNIYGMTGGQLAPTTPMGHNTTTTPYGYGEEPIDAVQLAKAAGATYIARWTTSTMRGFMKSLKTAIDHKGFSFIEVISQCPTQYGHKNNFPSPIELFNNIKANSVRINQAENMTPEELHGKYIIGDHLEVDRPTLYDRKLGSIQNAKKTKET
jgi:2-oxoglutarate ferredoxin oxidoreductase subunit beta